MKAFLLIFLTTLYSSLPAQQAEFYSYIPKGYDTLQGGVSRGDLNKDGIEDIALALYPQGEDNENLQQHDAENMPKRLAIILFGTANGFKQAAKSSTAIMCKNCGGAFGDPFQGIEIARGVLTFLHYGGSAWRWSYSHKFRFQNNNWYLIGKTSNSYWNVKQCEEHGDFAGTEYEDINFITGQYERKKISENCELVENKKGKKKVLPLLSLTKFSIE